MEVYKFSREEVELLNSKMGLRTLLRQKRKINYQKTLRYVRYEDEIRKLQAELIKMQTWAIENDECLVFVFEGRDAAGKGGAIRRVIAHLNPRHYRHVALPKPTEDERKQWYFQRYVNVLPKPGEIVFFDRSWYNRAVVEPVNGFCTQEEYEIFMSQVNEFEKMLIQSKIKIVKFYLSITKNQQLKRFNDIKADPLKRWKMTPVDERAQELWDQYTEYKKKMFEHTNTELCPWKIIRANRKTQARIAVIKHILREIPYPQKDESLLG